MCKAPKIKSDSRSGILEMKIPSRLTERSLKDLKTHAEYMAAMRKQQEEEIEAGRELESVRLRGERNREENAKREVNPGSYNEFSSCLLAAGTTSPLHSNKSLFSVSSLSPNHDSVATLPARLSGRSRLPQLDENQTKSFYGQDDMHSKRNSIGQFDALSIACCPPRKSLNFRSGSLSLQPITDKVSADPAPREECLPSNESMGNNTTAKRRSRDLFDDVSFARKSIYYK